MDEETIKELIKPFLAEQAEYTMWESLQAFYHAIDWSEGWIIALLVLHLTLLIIVIVTRRIMIIQIPTFLSLLFLIYNSERFNTMAATHWQQFATQNYFDPSGIFISALFSFPLLLIALIILINLVLENVRMLVKVKRAEVKMKNNAHANSGSNNKEHIKPDEVNKNKKSVKKTN